MAEGSNSAELQLPPAEAPEQAPDQQQEQAAESQTAPIESVGKAQESTTGKQTAQVYAPPAMPLQVPADTPAPAAPAQPLTDDDKAVAALTAKDGDLIEKEWVERAKHVISQTVNDPHKQKHEVSKMKAAYIQKRFNKTVKTDEATASG